MPKDAEPSAPAEKQPDYIVGENEDIAHLYRLILTLQERKREIITLRYYGGLRNQEIAKYWELAKRRFPHTSAVR